MPQPDRRRRKAVTLASLVPALLIFFWGPLTAPSGEAVGAWTGVLAGAAVMAAVVWWASSGVRERHGARALFVLVYGACILASAAGDGVADALAPPSPSAGGPGGESFGWFAYTPGGVDGEGEPVSPGEYGTGLTAIAAEQPSAGSLLPSGSGDGAIAFGWAAGLAAVAAYRRTAPAHPAADPSTGAAD